MFIRGSISRNNVFPKTNGNVAWECLSDTIEKSFVEDLFWRKIQVSRDFAERVVKTVFPDAFFDKQNREEIIINDKIFVSLQSQSRGCYRRGGNNGNYLPELEHNIDDKTLKLAIQDENKQGYYLMPMIAEEKGWKYENIVKYILEKMEISLTYKERFHFHEKSCHRFIHKDFDIKLAKESAQNSFPVKIGYSIDRVFWYKTEKGNIKLGIVYYRNKDNKLVKLPVTAWKNQYHNIITYDLINIPEEYPLYDLDNLYKRTNCKFAIVCNNEYTVEYIKENHKYFLKYAPITTYTSLSQSDFSSLKGMEVIYIPDNTVSGCYEAFKFYERVIPIIGSIYFLKRSKIASLGKYGFDKELCTLNFLDNNNRFDGFVEYASKEYGVTPPEGVLPIGVPIFDLRDDCEKPEVLLEDLLNAQEQMMIYAWRGVGKSLFAIFLGLCFATGSTALNGRVCPTRPYRVLLLDGEMSAGEVRKRAERLLHGHKLPHFDKNNFIVISKNGHDRKIDLETDDGWNKVKSYFNKYEIIIVDSVFKFFPSAMSTKFEDTKKLQERLEWCKAHRKTLILIDHEGKGGDTPFGSMGKDIALDTVIRLKKSNSRNIIQVYVQKVRNHPEPLSPYLEMKIESDANIKDSLSFHVVAQPKLVQVSSGVASDHDGATKSPMSPAERTALLDEAIKQSFREKPDAAQGVIVTALMDRGYGGRSTIQARIKVLSEGGQLPAWKNRPKSHKVAGQPASEGDQN